MRALREWLIESQWFILQCDPGPVRWSIWALSPGGEVMSFTGSEANVTGWDKLLCQGR